MFLPILNSSSSSGYKQKSPFYPRVSDVLLHVTCNSAARFQTPMFKVRVQVVYGASEVILLRVFKLQ